MSSAVYQYFINRLGATEANLYDSLQLRMNCCYCHLKGESRDENQKLYVHLGKMKSHCHRCKESRDVRTLLQDILGEDFSVIKDYLADLESVADNRVDMQDTLMERLFPQVTSILPDEVVLPREYTMLTPDLNSMGALLAYEYLFSREVPLETISELGIGFCSYGRYKNRLIIPCYEDGKIVYFINRLYMWDNKIITSDKERELKALKIPKSLNMPRIDKETGKEYIGKSDVVYNIDNARKGRHGVVVEGAFDVFRVGNSALGILGSFLSKVQAHKIIKCRFERVYVALDPDARKSSYKAVKMLSAYVPTYIIELQDTDPGSTPREVFNVLLENAKPFDVFKVGMRDNLTGG